MHDLNLVVALSAAVVIILGLLSGTIRRGFVSVPMVALGVGLGAGPSGLALVDPAVWPDHHRILEEAARFTLAISVMGIALRTPIASMRALMRPVILLLTLGMLGMWLATSALALLILGLPVVVGLLIGAILAPTDPVVASAIVTGRFAQDHLPDRVRSTLSLESGANDGLGYLFVLLPILLLQHGLQAGGGAAEALHAWLVDVVGVGVVLGIAIGLALGALVGWLLRRLDRAGIVEEHSLLSLSIALSLLAVAGAKLAGSDGILAAFAAGLGFNLTVDRREEQAEENIQEAIAKLFNLPIFVLLGLALPVAEWLTLGPSAVLFALAVLTLRRPPVLALLRPLLRDRLDRRDVAFLGWFGPIGVAALYYSLLAVRETGIQEAWPLASLVITTSVVVHGLTAAPLTRRYARAEAHAAGAHQ